MALTHLSTGGGPGAVQECGGRAQCYALLLTVYSTGGGQPSTVQVIEGLTVEKSNGWPMGPYLSLSGSSGPNYLANPTNIYMISFVYIWRSICFHPSLLPRHRGASAISWTLIEGDTTGGFSIFYPDAGLDTGDLLLTRFECVINERKSRYLCCWFCFFVEPAMSPSMILLIAYTTTSCTQKV